MTAVLIATCNIPLSSCGFSPVYATSGKTSQTSAKSALSNIDIAIIPNREGQFLRNALMDRFYTNGIPAQAPYSLQIAEIKENIYDFDITIDSEATRRQMRLSTKMTIIDNQTKEKVLTRDIISVASHNVLNSEFSTLVTEQNTRENVLNDLARQIERQTALFFDNK